MHMVDLWQYCECTMLNKITVTRCSLFMVPLPWPHVTVRVTRGALVAHRHTYWILVAHRNDYSIPCCRTSQYRRTIIPLPVSLWNDLADPVFDDMGQAVLKSRVNTFLLAKAVRPFLSSTVFPLSSFLL